MTIEELYNWATKNDCEDYEVEIQYRDDGGDYSGTDNNIYCIVDTDNKKVIL